VSHISLLRRRSWKRKGLKTEIWTAVSSAKDNSYASFFFFFSCEHSTFFSPLAALSRTSTLSLNNSRAALYNAIVCVTFTVQRVCMYNTVCITQLPELIVHQKHDEWAVALRLRVLRVTISSKGRRREALIVESMFTCLHISN